MLPMKTRQLTLQGLHAITTENQTLIQHIAQKTQTSNIVILNPRAVRIENAQANDSLLTEIRQQCDAAHIDLTALEQNIRLSEDRKSVV